MNPTELPARARIARKLLKLLALPIIILAVVVKWTTPPWTWWVDGVFIGLCLVVVILLIVGRISIYGKVATEDSSKEHGYHS